MKKTFLQFIKQDVKFVVAVAFILTVFVMYGGVGFVNAARTIDFFKKSGDNIIFTNASYELGGSSDRVAKGWFTDLDTTNITIGGASAGAIDMGGFAITNAGTTTVTNLIATSTTANSGIGTSTPQRQLSVDSGASATTTVQIGDVYSGTAATCFEVAENDGSITSFYFVGGAIVIETKACI